MAKPSSASPPPTEDTPDLPGGPGAAFTFTYYFSGAALITALVAVKTLGVGFSAGITGQLALTVGSLGGLLGVFYNRTKTLEIPFSSRKSFIQTLNAALQEMGYLRSEMADSLWIYQRTRLGRLFSGDIYVQLQDKSAVVVSRAGNIRALQKQLN